MSHPWSHPSEPPPLLTPLCACVQPEGQISHEGFLWKRASLKYQASPHALQIATLLASSPTAVSCPRFVCSAPRPLLSCEAPPPSRLNPRPLPPLQKRWFFIKAGTLCYYDPARRAAPSRPKLPAAGPRRPTHDDPTCAATRPLGAQAGRDRMCDRVRPAQLGHCQQRRESRAHHVSSASRLRDESRTLGP